jgi:integrase/recombinase XerC
MTSKSGGSGRDLRQAIDGFLQACFAAGRRPSTLDSYKYGLSPFLKYAHREKVTWPPATEYLRGYLAYKRASGCKEVTVKSYYRILHTFFNWCEAEGLLGETSNPAEGLKIPIEEQRIPRAVDRARLKRLFDVISSAGRRGYDLAVRDHALFRLIYDTGIRNGEASKARLDDLDLGEQSLLIRQAKGLPRVTYFGRMTTLALRTWLDVRPVGGKWLFTGHNQMFVRLGVSGIYTRLQYWCEVAGVGRFRVHDLRHSHATHALRLGVPIVDVQHQLGHRQLSTTERYLWSFDVERGKAYRLHSPGDELLKLNTLEEV